MSVVQIKRKKPTAFVDAIEVIYLSQPTTRDIFGLDFMNPKKTMESYAILISRCSCLSIREIENLDTNEFMKLQIKMADLLLKGE